jgi:translation initiation factor IF-3
MGRPPTFRSAPRYRRVEGNARAGVCRWSDPRSAGLFFRPRTEKAAIATDKRVRVNRQIRISPVRVIGEDGEQLGIMPVEEALETAESKGLDLVEVAPNSRPPVVRIMDYGKFKYEQARKARQAKKKQQHVQLKEVKFRPGIDEHDLEFKLRHARRFLEDGNKVKATMMFRGRQVAHPELGREVLSRVAGELEDVGKVESNPVLEGRNMIMVLAPRK